FAAGTLVMVSDLGDAVSIPDGTVVAYLTVHDISGRSQRIPIVAGRDTSEVAHDRPDVRHLVRHRRPRVFSGSAAAYHSVSRFPIATRQPIARVDVHWIYPDPARGGITVEKLSLVNERSGKATAFDDFAPFYAEPDRWRKIALDPSITAFSNARAMPRAWFAL